LTSSYISGEDSELLRKVAKRYKGQKCLEIGIGSGSNLMELSENFDWTVGTDIDYTDGFNRVKKRASGIFHADRATCFRDQVFDLVIMNPPYLPSDTIEDRAVDGGKEGFEIPTQFLKEAVRVISPLGVILIVLSSFSPFSRLMGFCEQEEMTVKEIESKSLFFEKLCVYEIRKGSFGLIQGIAS
jgi:release factor glutamine methyltransferase